MKFDQEKKEFGAWWVWIVLLIIGATVAFGIVNSLGLIGSTFVERKVFEQSYQRSEAYKGRIGIMEATLAELHARKAQPNLTAATKAEIDTQITAINAQLSAARSQQ